VLIESGEKENLVALERAADGASELLLAIVRLERQEGVDGAEGTVAQVVEDGAVDVVGAGFGDDVDDRAAGASLFGAVGIGGDAELLYNFGGKLVGSAIASASLGEEGVVVVAAVDEGGVLESANAAEGEIAVGGGGEAVRGSCVTPGENRARSEKRRPFRGKSFTARSSRSVETALG